MNARVGGVAMPILQRSVGGRYTSVAAVVAAIINTTQSLSRGCNAATPVRQVLACAGVRARVRLRERQGLSRCSVAVGKYPNSYNGLSCNKKCNAPDSAVALVINASRTKRLACNGPAASNKIWGFYSP